MVMEEFGKEIRRYGWRRLSPLRLGLVLLGRFYALHGRKLVIFVIVLVIGA